jgi:hypothetical protein
VQTTSTLNPKTLAALETFQVSETPTTDTQPAAQTLRERILESFAVAQAYALQIQDPEFRKNFEKKLVTSNVRGSIVMGIQGPEDVATMLGSINDWKPVVANLKDAKILVFQGTLPKSYRAQTAYATMREIAEMFGQPGVGSIQAKIGYQKKGEMYLCSMLKMPTTQLTVQLKTDESGIEHLHQWFAGIELSSRLRIDDADNIVRVNSQIQPLDQSQPAGHQIQRGRGREYRAQRASS